MKMSCAFRWLFCAAGTLGMLALALAQAWPRPIPAFAVITVAAICLWISSAMPGTLVAMLLPAVYILCGAGTPAQVLSPWTSPMCWLVLGGVIISVMMEKSGVSRRIALWALKSSGSSLRRLFWGIMLAGFLIAPFVPTAMGKAALFVVILGGICATLELKPGSREASCIFLCGLLVLACPKFLFFTSSVDSALLITTAKRCGMELSWLQYFKANAVPGLIYAIACILLLTLFAPRKTRDFRRYVEDQYHGLGPVNSQEKKAFVLLGLVALAMVTDSWHGWDIGWLMMVFGGLCFAPGVRLLDADDLRSLPLGIVFFIAGCMCIGSTAQAVGVNALLAEQVTELFQAGPKVTTLMGAFAAGLFMSLGFTTLPAISTMTPALTQVGLASGNAGPSLLYAYLYGLDQYIMPYVFAPALYFYASGYISLGHYLGFQGLKLVLAIVFLLAVAIPWWALVL